MNNPRRSPVRGRDGMLGWLVDNSPTNDIGDVSIELEDGRTMLVSNALLVQQNDGSYYLPMSRDQFVQEQAGSDLNRGQQVIPVIVEEAEVTKQRTTQARVLIHKNVREQEQVIDEPGFSDRVDVERVPVNRPVDAPPKVRFEGETMVIPVLEEVLVVQKQLILKEEVRVTRRRTQTRNPQRVTLRAEDVQVERLEPDQS